MFVSNDRVPSIEIFYVCVYTAQNNDSLVWYRNFTIMEMVASYTLHSMSLRFILSIFQLAFIRFKGLFKCICGFFFLSMTFDCQPKSTSLFCLECFSCFMCHWDDSITNECLYVFSVYWTWIYSCCFYSERSKLFMRVYRAVSELFWQLHGNPIVYYLHLFIFRLY